MIADFKEVSFEGFSPIGKAIGDFPSNLCDFTPFVILTWQKFNKTEYDIIDSHLFFKYLLDGKNYYSFLSSDTTEAIKTLFLSLNTDTLSLSLISEKILVELRDSFEVIEEKTNEDWWDYVYLREDLATFKGKRFSGQRNHINKFVSSHPLWTYEEINEENLHEVLDFYKRLSSDTSDYNETALYEKEMLIKYLEKDYYNLRMSGALIRDGKDIVAFAFGEVLHDMLFVHVEKADRDVQGAYQMMVREFASHNSTTFINREEDMGLEGLRKSKMSYHPLRQEKKYTVTIKK
ncbi:MAG: DUF2156 domain-containing protein [Ruminococcaceae bacterium]|nr:DUF2156 domain-containing protein [Oscillospiraceae bacterium]